jgi:hypothetical protein
VNNYGYDVDVRSSPSVVDERILDNGGEREIKLRTKSPRKFVIRILDRRDGIPILINGDRYVPITPKSSPLYRYNILIRPGRNTFLNFVDF